MKYTSATILAFLTLARHQLLFVGAFALLVGCGGGNNSGSAGGGVVSCDIIQGGLHYCEEAPGSPSSNSGCPTMMAGFTPGTGCSRDNLAGSCQESPYEIFFYGSGQIASEVAAVCPSGGFQASASGGSGTNDPLHPECGDFKWSTGTSDCFEAYGPGFILDKKSRKCPTDGALCSCLVVSAQNGSTYACEDEINYDAEHCAQLKQKCVSSGDTYRDGLQ